MADKTAFDYVNEIWSIANYVRDVIRPADYNKLILPFAVLRRFECALEPTRAAVSRQAAKGVWDDDDPKYCALSGHCFYNVTSFTLSNLGATKTCDALMAYINGFSVNAREVLQRFEMRQTCEKLDEKGMLYEVLPYAPDAVVDESVKDEPKYDAKSGLTANPLGDGGVGVVGTTISFNRYFYKYEKPRDPQVIAKEILELEDGLGELMRGFLA